MPNLPRWPGATIACLASGPTLTADACARVRESGLPVIAVNDAVRLAPWAPVLYSSDRTWWAHYRGVPDFAGVRVSVGARRGTAARFPGAWGAAITVLTHTGVTGLERDPSGLRTGGHSGYAAINLAVHLGARTILLLGYTCGTIGRRSHFFGAHPSGLNESSERNFRDFRQAYTTLAPALTEAGVTVRNCTPETRITAFWCADLGGELEQATHTPPTRLVREAVLPC